MLMTPILISLELATDPWGVHVDRVEIKDVRLPQQMQVGDTGNFFIFEKF